MHSGGTEDAIACFDRILDAGPNNIRAMTAKGIALLGLGRNESALAAFDLAISINPINTFVWQHRAEALRRLGRNAEADESHQHVFDK